ncbi:PQQ-dependent sugar dehydrogenase [Microbacterium ureisolvens]|uniref:PQQ-dependent sugar dehydrogenase n=1 Tax=Microbacterium ureisolvens TaxID=2781186 RepID=UPI00363B09EF
MTGALASGLSTPWSVVPLAGGGALISQRDDGAVRQLTPDGELRTVGTIPGVVSGGESGLHGLALLTTDEPAMLYAYFGSAEDNRVVRMPLLGDAGALALGEAEVVLDGIPRASTHDGGRLAFGPDGFLYITTGDAQQRDAVQDADALGGKILRVTVDGEPAPGNPWGTRVWSMGHRNVQGIAWTADGTMWASEFGQNTWDELNRIEAGANYGWPVVEGEAGRTEFVDPVAQWPTSEASPSGIAAVGDTVFMAGLRGERLWQIDTRSGEAAGEPVAALVGAHGRLRDAVALPDGSLWILTSNTDGRGAPRADDDLLLRVELVPEP